MGMAGPAGFVDSLGIQLREWIPGAANTVNTVATEAIRSPPVFGFQQEFAVRAVLVFRQLVSGQGWIEALHKRRVRMAPGTKGKNPAAVLVATCAGPFLHERVFKFVVGGITTMTTGTRKSA